MNRRLFISMMAAALFTTAKLTGLAETDLLIPEQRVFDMEIIPVAAGETRDKFSLVIMGTGPDRPSTANVEFPDNRSENPERWSYSMRVFGSVDKDICFAEAERLYELTA